MYRHELRFVLRFGVRQRFEELVRRLHDAEAARGWATPRIWHAVHGRVNELVIEHDYDDVDAYRRERQAFHDDPGDVGPVLAELSELVVPGTAVEAELSG
jgi:hypothetical protein